MMRLLNEFPGLGPLRRTERVATALSIALVTLVAPGIGVAAAQPVSAASSSSCSGTLPRGTVVGMAATNDDGGYWIANSQGLVVSCGDAPNLGALASRPSYPIVALAATADGGGYYLVGSDGGVFAFGDAAFHGSTGSLRLAKPIVGMAIDPETNGYWLVASDGGIFAFDAPFFGSTGSFALNQPVVGMATTSDGHGYWLDASDGGIFAFGDARFEGSTGGMKLNRPVVGMASDPATVGYWLVASDGGIFAFKAPFFGSTGNVVLAEPMVGMEANRNGTGYRFVASDGGVFDFGSSAFFGSAVAPVTQTCSVTLSNYNPPDYSDVTATIQSDVPNASVTLSKAYRTTTSYDYGTTAASGGTSITFYDSGATVGYKVVVTAKVGSAQCTTSFTPS
jgi:hypothetical protein